LANDDVAAKLRQTLPNLPPDAAFEATPIPGLYELRIGTDVMYVDAKGQYLLRGEIIDLKNQINLTQARVDELLRIPFDQLPLKDGFQIKRGNGKRQLVIFEDPNCGYCKRLERDMASMSDLTVTVMLIPVLGKDSLAKSQAIWCADDRVKAWEEWMIDGIKPAEASCDTSAIDRNLAFARRHQINGTPTIFFIDGSRVPGAVPASDIEKRLQALHPRAPNTNAHGQDRPHPNRPATDHPAHRRGGR
jgi:thiol:disulfide interchange protein DsbC